MRASREAATASRNRITRHASRLMRQRGVAATSLSDAMAAAGMTTGGFYKHFKSKDELAKAAVADAFGEITAMLDKAIAEKGPAAARQAYFETYISTGHVNHPEMGCPVASLGPDAGRQPEVLGEEFTRGIEELITRLADSPDSEARGKLMRKMAGLIGTVVLARAVGPSALRDEILAQARPLLA